MKSLFIRLFIFSLFLRLSLSLLFSHGDVNNHAIWGIYSQEFGLRGFYDWINFGNYAWPGYPPLSLITFYLSRLLWQLFFNFFWYLNVNISFFPSDFIPWFENQGYYSFLKIPGILADLGIGYLIYGYFEKQKSKLSIFYSSLYLLNPATWYISSMWGQIESVVFFFMLLAVIKLIEGNKIKGIIAYYISLLFKVTSLVGLPVLAIRFLRDRKKLFKYITIIALLIIVITFVVSYVFIDKNYLIWFFNTYLYRLVPGPTTLPFISVNAFNLWTLILGSDLVNDHILFSGFQLKSIAYFVSSIFFGIILYKYHKVGKIFWALTLIFFAAFLFLPRMHERYLFPLVVFMPFMVGKSKELLGYFYVLSFIFFLNLYNLWWVPKIGFLVNFLSYDVVTRILSFVNIYLFMVLLIRYLKIKTAKWDFR